MYMCYLIAPQPIDPTGLPPAALVSGLQSAGPTDASKVSNGWQGRRKRPMSWWRTGGWGFNPSEKYESIGMIPKFMEKNMFQTTNQPIVRVISRDYQQKLNTSQVEKWCDKQGNKMCITKRIWILSECVNTSINTWILTTKRTIERRYLYSYSYSGFTH